MGTCARCAWGPFSPQLKHQILNGRTIIKGFDFAVQAMRKLHGHLRAVREAAVGATLPQARPAAMRPHADDLDAELDEAAQVEHELDDHLGCDVLEVGLRR